MKMKVSLMSDVHLGHWQHPMPAPDNKELSDVLILAGDIVDFVRLKNEVCNGYLFLSECAKNYEHVIYIPGNHEWYQSVFSDYTFNKVKTLLSPIENLHFVNNQVVPIGNVNFVCSTLWSKILDEEKDDVQWSLADYSYISSPSGKLLTIEESNLAHEISFNFIQDAVRAFNRNVIVTHHLPSYASVDSRFRRGKHQINSAFATELKDFILDNTDVIPFLCHGHTHDPYNYYIGKSNILCNPRGYPKERNTIPYYPLQFEV